MESQMTPARVQQREIDEATAYVKLMGLKEALRRLEDAEPDLWTEIVRTAVGATEPFRKMGILDDIGGSVREDMLLALVVAAESVRLSNYRRSQAAGGAVEAAAPALPLNLLAPTSASASARRAGV